MEPCRKNICRANYFDFNGIASDAIEIEVIELTSDAIAGAMTSLVSF